MLSNTTCYNGITIKEVLKMKHDFDSMITRIEIECRMFRNLATQPMINQSSWSEEEAQLACDRLNRLLDVLNDQAVTTINVSEAIAV